MTAPAASQHGASTLHNAQGSRRSIEVGLQSGKPRVQHMKAGDPIGDVGSPLIDEARQFVGRLGAMTRVAPAGDPGSILERDIEAPQVDQQRRCSTSC